MIKFTAVLPKGDKVSRLAAVTPTMEQGKVFLPAEAPWLRTLMEELVTFPFASFDDQVDSISQFMNWHKNQNTVKVMRLTGL